MAAVVLGMLLLLYFLLTVRYSVGEPDEASYYVLGHHIAMGARMISDEWHLTQFGFLPVLPLYFLYAGVTGGTEGLVLFMRYVFIAADIAFYSYMYVKLRRFRFAGVLAAFFYCAMIPQTFLGFSYCTISSAVVMTICLMLFSGEKKASPLRLFFAGVLLAVAVLEDPFLVFLFLFWLCFVFVYRLRRRAKTPFCADFSHLLNARAFWCVTAGCAAVFAVFMAVLLLNGAFEEISTVLPYLFSGSEYNFSNLLQLASVYAAAKYFGTAFPVGLLCGVLAAAAVRF